MKLFSFLPIVYVALVGALYAQSTPSRYDLRDYGLDPAMQNQGDASICWAVASCSAIQSNLLKKGLITPSGDDLYVSAWHMAANSGVARCLNYNPNTGDYERDDESFGWGGDAFYSNLWYLTRGKGTWRLPDGVDGDTVTLVGGGPALFSNEGNQIPNDSWANEDNLESVLPGLDQSVALLTRGLYTIGKYGGEAQLDSVKDAISTYGAVTTGIFIGGSSDNICAKQEYGEKNTYYYVNTAPAQGANHEVTIIGWDDNYTINGEQGAWIIQNSWGSPSEGEEGALGGQGVFYVSFNDAVVGKDVTVFDMELSGRYNQEVIQHDPGFIDEFIGEEDILGFIDGYKAATLFDLESLTLGGLGLIGAKDDVISVSLYDAAGWGEGGNWDIDPERALYNYVVAFSETGYTLFDFEEGIILPDGSLFLIIVDYLVDEDGEGKDIAYSKIHSGFDASDYEGLSFYFDGEDWIDFATLDGGGVFFLKGFTLAIPEPGSIFMILSSGAFLLVGRRRYSGKS